MPGPTTLPAAFGLDPGRPPPPPPGKAKRRFDIASLLAESPRPGPRAPLRTPAAWSAGCPAGGMLLPPPPALYLAQPEPGPLAPAAPAAPGLLPPAPARPCDPRGCPRPGLDFPSCILAHSLGASLSWRSGGPCKMKRVRTVFTPEQLERLEKEFLKQQYMVGTERVDLAATLHLTETQVKVWFQNRRIKWRKQSLEQKEAKRSQLGMAQAAKQPEETGSDENDVDVED